MTPAASTALRTARAYFAARRVEIDEEKELLSRLIADIDAALKQAEPRP